MDDNNLIMKCFNYIWIIIVLIPFFNGIGFIFAGWRINETKLMDEGIIYMIPFILISLSYLDMNLIYLEIILWIIGIVRAALLLKTYTKKLQEKQNETNENILDTNYQLNQFYEKNNFDNNTYPKNVNKLKINVNNATYNELLQIPQFNDEKATKLIQTRENQRINSMEKLSSKLNLNPDEIKEIEKHICFKDNENKEKVRRLDL